MLLQFYLGGVKTTKQDFGTVVGEIWCLGLVWKLGAFRVELLKT
jgi:hypothetical protein